MAYPSEEFQARRKVLEELGMTYTENVEQNFSYRHIVSFPHERVDGVSQEKFDDLVYWVKQLIAEKKPWLDNIRESYPKWFFDKYNYNIDDKGWCLHDCIHNQDFCHEDIRNTELIFKRAQNGRLLMLPRVLHISCSSFRTYENKQFICNDCGKIVKSINP